MTGFLRIPQNFAKRNFGGWLLVGLIILVSGVIVALAGASFLISGQLRVAALRQNQAKAIALAHAGIMQAIYDFRFNDPAVGGTDTGFRLGEYAVPADTGQNTHSETTRLRAVQMRPGRMTGPQLHCSASVPVAVRS